jgi:hypothetical protein
MSSAFEIPLSGVNIVIKNDAWNADLEHRLFHGENINHIPANSQHIDLFDMLVMLDIFTSRGQAKKSWNREGGPDWPPGFHDWFIGKKKTRITIWNPIPDIPQ